MKGEVKSWVIHNLGRNKLTIFIYPSLARLRRETRKPNCVGLTVVPASRRQPISVHLPVDTSVGVAAHEAVHVAQALYRRSQAARWQKVIENEEEERLAYPVGEVTEWIWSCIEAYHVT